jgi:hypothetical protein
MHEVGLCAQSEEELTGLRTEIDDLMDLYKQAENFKVRSDAITRMTRLIAARERKAAELESLETGKYVASQIINGVSAQDLYSAFCKSIAELTSTKDKS